MTSIHPFARIDLKALLTGGVLLALGGLFGCGPGAAEQRRNDYISAHPEIERHHQQLDSKWAGGAGNDQGSGDCRMGRSALGLQDFQTNLQTIWDYCHHPGRTLVIFNQSGRVSNVQMP